MNREAKPANFYKFPFDSVLRKSEAETIAQNIMRILHRKGNEWRELSWEEYVEERLKDAKDDACGFSEKEKAFFDQVIGYTISAKKATEFCEKWYSEIPDGTKGILVNLATNK